MIGLAKQDKGVCTLNLDGIAIKATSPINISTNLSSIIDSKTWHNRLGHLLDGRLKILHTMDLLIPQNIGKTCDTCH